MIENFVVIVDSLFSITTGNNSVEFSPKTALRLILKALWNKEKTGFFRIPIFSLSNKLTNLVLR